MTDGRASVAGDDLLSVPADSAAQAASIALQLRDTGFWLEAVSGIESVVVRFDSAAVRPDTALEVFEAQLENVGTEEDTVTGLLEIPLVYGGEAGPDFEAVLATAGLDRKAFIERHTAREYRVEMLGFTPGFAYLGEPDPGLDMPRLDEPRVHVNAGSVGIAAGRTGIYSLPGPGGWHLIGRTDLTLFDAAAEAPFRLQPGLRIRFRDSVAETE